MITFPQCFRENGSPPRSGFALIISMVLMGFILLLLLSLSALTRVETGVADADQLREQARMNALLGLNIALAQLQETAGADRRATATALLERDETGAEMTPLDGGRHWTGVWGHGAAPYQMQSTPVFLNWLVSGNEARKLSVSGVGTVDEVNGVLAFKPNVGLPAISSGTTATTRLQGQGQSWRLLVGGNSVSEVADYVVAPFVPLKAGNDNETGGYAYWIGDEGVKAALHAVEGDAVLQAGSGDEKGRLRYRRPGRSGVEALNEDWIASLAAAADASTEAGAMLRRQLERILQKNQLELLDQLPADFTRDYFHDTTPWSYGLLTDTLNGGLRKDLTVGFAPGTTWANKPEGLVWEPFKASIVAANDALMWHSLRTWYQFADIEGDSLPITKSGTDWKGGHPLSPIVASWQWFVQARVRAQGVDGDGKPLYQLGYRMYPALVLWNPFNVTLRAKTLQGSYASNTIDSEATRRGDTRRVVFATRVWEQASGGSGSSFAPAFVEGAQYIAPWSEQIVVKNGKEYPAPFHFLVDTEDMAPGMAYVYTLEDDVAYNTTNTAAANYRLKRGWHFSSGSFENAAIYAWSPDTFALPEGKEPDDYQVGFWISSGTQGGDLSLYAWDASITGVNNSADWGIVGNDAFELDDVGRGGTLRLQAIHGINASLRTQMIADMWEKANAPLLSSALGSNGSIGFYGQRWALKVTRAADIYRVSAASSGEAEFNNPIRWLANYNPRTPFSDRTPFEKQSLATNGYYNSNPAYNRVTTLGQRAGQVFDPAATWFLVNHDSETGAAYTGISQDPDTGSPQPVILFDVPRPDARVLSIGALQHANLTRPTSVETFVWSSNATPAYAIGNSLADPRVGLERYRLKPYDVRTSTSGYGANDYMLDYSYVLNRALWDGYYFSSVPYGTEAVVFPLDNARYVRHGSPSAADLRDYDKSAAHLLVKGAFNVNSASVAAWRALLASFNGVPVGSTAQVKKSAYPRFSQPGSGQFSPSTVADDSQSPAAYNDGFRSLTQDEINALAPKIVDEVRARGPFLSLADFVNRSLLPPEENQLMGALAAALEKAGINDSFKSEAVEIKTNAVMDKDIEIVARAYDGVSATHVPGWLTQADLLQSLSPVLAARSDTFVIRVCGEASRPGDASASAFAWCEAVVQRLPEYLNGDAAWDAPTEDNQTLGRSFRIVSLRWLSEEDI